MKSESFFLEDDTGSIFIPGDLIPDIQKHYFQRKSEDRKLLEFQGIDEKDVIKFDYDSNFLYCNFRSLIDWII